MRRASYQKGSLRLAHRKKGKVWEFLWREVQLDGTIRRKHIVIGTQEDLPTESCAQAAVDAIRLEINQQTPQRLIKRISFETLVNHYRQHELPDIFNKTKPGLDAADEDRKSYSTQVTYEGYLKKWILPRWRSCRLTDVKATEVEKWRHDMSAMARINPKMILATRFPTCGAAPEVLAEHWPATDDTTPRPAIAGCRLIQCSQHAIAWSPVSAQPATPRTP